MKKIGIILSALLCSVAVFAQTTTYTISGRVIDAVTKAPMASASVFAQSTTIGTATDADGKFTLQLPNGGYDLAVTFTGYETGSRRITTGDAMDKNIVIEIKQKEKELQDVVIRSSSEVADGWEKYGDFFLENFIGKTTNSADCHILNKEVLKFYLYKRSNRLKVMSKEPLQIENDALGYRIKYQLDSFVHEYNTEVNVFSGYPLFEEMKPVDDAQQKKWSDARKVAYNGSILHFMRSIYRKQLKEEGFELQFLLKPGDGASAVTPKDIYGAMNYNKDDSTQTVEIYPNQLNVAVIYDKEVPGAGYLLANPGEPSKYQASIISFLPDASIIIEPNGYYFEQTNFTISAYWTWEKVADMLPYDYQPNG